MAGNGIEAEIVTSRNFHFIDLNVFSLIRPTRS